MSIYGVKGKMKKIVGKGNVFAASSFTIYDNLLKWFLRQGHYDRDSMVKAYHREEKRPIAHNEQFLHFPQCFVPIWRTFCHLDQI